jgi:acyl dehydratase
MPAEDFIGLQGPEYTMDIECGKVRDFARAMNAPLPEYLEGEHPLIPATFLITAAYSWGYSLERPRGSAFEQIDHDLSVPLHAEESFTFHGAVPRAGDRLHCRASLEDVWRKQGGRGGELTFLTMLTEFRDAGGGLVAEERSTTVTTANAPDAEDWKVDIPDYRPDYPDDLDPGDPFAAIERSGWNGVEPGAKKSIACGPLLIGDIVRFQSVVGEDNPLHYDLAWAKSLGYPNVFGLGSQQASMLAAIVAHWFEPAALVEFRARFRNVFWPGEALTYAAQVSKKYRAQESGHRILELRLVCSRNDDDPVVDAWLTLDFDREGCPTESG